RGLRRGLRGGDVRRSRAVGAGILLGTVLGAVEDPGVLSLRRLEGSEVGVDGIRVAGIAGVARHIGAGRSGSVESLVGAAYDVIDVIRPVVLGNLGVAHGFASRG